MAPSANGIKIEGNAGSAKIHVLEPGNETLDVIRTLANSGVQEEAFYILDVGDVIRKHEEWKLKMPRVSPFYAVKCNNDRTVLETLVSLGASFDCASIAEIAAVLDCGVEADRIIFAHPVKQEAHVRYAAAVNVRTMTFDSESELYKVKENHPTAKMVLRIRCDAKKALVQLGNKFGAFPKDAPRLMALARQLGVDIVGISFHVGTGCEEPEVFERCIAIGRQLFDQAASDYGFNMTILDLGGGYPGHRGSSIDKFASIINASLDRYFPHGCGVDIIAEPGTYYVASAFTLAARIHGRRDLMSDDDGSVIKHFYHMNDGFYGSFGCILNDGLEVIPRLLDPRPGPASSCSIWGPTADSTDCIAANASLPLLNIGDWLVFDDMGAYTLAVAGCFNGFPVPKVYPVIHSDSWQHVKDRCNTFVCEAQFAMGSPSPAPTFNLIFPKPSATDMYVKMKTVSSC